MVIEEWREWRGGEEERRTGSSIGPHQHLIKIAEQARSRQKRGNDFAEMNQKPYGKERSKIVRIKSYKIRNGH